MFQKARPFYRHAKLCLFVELSSFLELKKKILLKLKPCCRQLRGHAKDEDLVEENKFYDDLKS